MRICQFKKSGECPNKECPGKKRSTIPNCPYQTLWENTPGRRAYRDAYNEDHKEEGKAYREAHKGQIAMRDRNYRLNNPEKYTAASQRKYQKNLEKILAKRKAKYRPVGKVRGYVTKTGAFIRTHSLSEAILGVAFEDAGIEAIRTLMPFKTPVGKYTPDFYLPKYDLYIEVKAATGDATYMAAKEKQYIKLAYLRADGVNIAYMDATEIQQVFFGEL